MNKIWLYICLICMFVLVFINPTNLFSSLLDSATKAANLELSLCATNAVLLGFFEILSHTKIPNMVAKIFSPIIDLIYGKNTLTKEAKNYISMSMSTNFLGLGSISTPLSIKSIQSLNTGKEKVNFAMVMFVVINATGLQLIPSTTIGILSGMGDATASRIILPTIVSSSISTIVGILLVKIFVKREKI